MATSHESLWSTAVRLRGNPRAAVWTEPMWGLSMALVLPYASVYMLALGLSDQQIGLLATIGILSQTVFGLLGGVITDKLGRRATTAVFDLVAWSVPCLIWAVAQNFWFFLGASLVNGAWQVTQNSWDCLLVEDAEPRLITRVYSLVRVAADLSALFAPVAAVLVARFGLEPAVRILYVNAFVVMTAKVWILYRASHETDVGRLRMTQVAGRSTWSLLREYRGVGAVIRRSPGTLYSVAVMAVVAAVALVTGTFWQIAVSQRLGVPDALLPFFPMARSILSMLFFFTLIPRLTGGAQLRRPTRWGFVAYLAGQLLLVAIPAADGARTSTYLLLGVTLVLDGFGGGILAMLAESLVALHVDKLERSRVMAMQRTAVMLVTAPFGWIAGWLSGVDRSWPFVLTSSLLVLGLVLTGWAPTLPQHDVDEPPLPVPPGPETARGM
ncbi:MFS transporter [Isoptericola sp. b441]|uniref:MFS transporter n=1 Tax=Actinotalea lenta TaxID=3064654 RepID=A0ABT9D6R2_9CELL|nr:MFS transporter [Isoptericola sp. b441]MDO8106210.1 MFS transporter [Isoptericola sp. b441]